MRWFASSRFFALALAIVLSLGLNLLPVHSGLMAAEMMAAADSGVPGQDGCGDCGNDTAATPECAVSCTAYTMALPSSGLTTATTDAPRKPLAGSRTSPGRLPAPDPHPPRTDEIG